MPIRRPALAVLLSLSLVAVPLPAAAKKKPVASSNELQLRDHLARDPLIAVALRLDDLGRSFDGMLEMLGRFADEEQSADVQRALRQAEEKLGFSLRDDLLAQLGPEVAVVLDLPPIDRLPALWTDPRPETLGGLLGGVGLLLQVRDAQRIESSLGRLFALAEAEITTEGALRRVALPLAAEGQPPQPGAPQLSEIWMYYGLREDRLALGFSADWVDATLGALPRGERLADGDDFARVFSHLDARPESLFYVNLPKVATMVRESQMLGALIQANPKAKVFVDSFLTPDYVGTGIGTTSVKLEDGVRQTSFGPHGLSGGALATGIIAAIAVPNLLNAIDRGKQKRTMADVRSLGIVCEAFFMDNGRYPGPTDGWVPVETIAEQVEPVYIRVMPRLDGWGNPILFWSDGASYRLVSHGKGGEADADWSGPLEPRGTVEATSDIVFADGEFVVYPGGTMP